MLSTEVREGKGRLAPKTPLNIHNQKMPGITIRNQENHNNFFFMLGFPVAVLQF